MIKRNLTENWLLDNSGKNRQFLYLSVCICVHLWISVVKKTKISNFCQNSIIKTVFHPDIGSHIHKIQ